MAAPLRYGIIGTGMMGVEHIANLLHLDGAIVTAISDPNATSRDWAQVAVGLDAQLQRFDHHRELLDAAVCDAVVIARPNFTHHDVLRPARRNRRGSQASVIVRGSADGYDLIDGAPRTFNHARFALHFERGMSNRELGADQLFD